MVQNGDIELTDVFIPENNRLEKAKDFATGAGMILLHSRLCLSWMVCGIAAGAYEAALRYTMHRTQFGKPIASFQLSQLKLSQMLAKCESMLSMVLIASSRFEEGKVSPGRIGRIKSYCT